MVLKKESVLFNRDEKGNLLPTEVDLVINDADEEQVKYKGEKISIIPMTRGEIKRVFSKPLTSDEEKDIDGELISKHCKDPSFTKEETNFMKPAYAAMLVNTIMAVSGLNIDNKKKAMDKKEDEFAKNSEELSQSEKKAI